MVDAAQILAWNKAMEETSEAFASIHNEIFLVGFANALHEYSEALSNPKYLELRTKIKSLGMFASTLSCAGLIGCWLSKEFRFSLAETNFHDGHKFGKFVIELIEEVSESQTLEASVPEVLSNMEVNRVGDKQLHFDFGNEIKAFIGIPRSPARHRYLLSGKEAEDIKNAVRQLAADYETQHS